MIMRPTSAQSNAPSAYGNRAVRWRNIRLPLPHRRRIIRYSRIFARHQRVTLTEGETVRHRSTLLLLIASSLMLSSGFPDRAAASNPGSLDSKTVAENRDLDQQLLKAHERKDAEMLLSLFSKRDDIFFIAPNGTLNKGPSGLRHSYNQFFAGLEWIRGEIKDVSYLPTENGVVAVGTVVFHRKPNGHPPEDRTVIWTDFRVKEGGKWVYLFRHAHWPLEPAK